MQTLNGTSNLMTVIGASLYRGALDNLKIAFENFDPSLESVAETEILSLSFDENLDSIIPSISKIGSPLLVHSDSQKSNDLSVGVVSVIAGQSSNVSIPVTGVLSNELSITLLSVPDPSDSGCQIFLIEDGQLTLAQWEILPAPLATSNLTVYCDKRDRVELYNITVSVSDGSFLIDSFTVELLVLPAHPAVVGSDISIFVSPNTSTRLELSVDVGKLATETGEESEVIIVTLPTQGDLAIDNQVLLYPFEVVEYDYQGNLEALTYAPRPNATSDTDEIRFAIRQGDNVTDTFSALLNIQSQLDVYNVGSTENSTLAGTAGLFSSIDSKISLSNSQVINNVSLILHFNSASSLEMVSPLAEMEIEITQSSSAVPESLTVAVVFDNFGQPALSVTGNQSLSIQLVSTGSPSKVMSGLNDGIWHRVVVTAAFLVEPFRILVNTWFFVDGDMKASPVYQVTMPGLTSSFVNELKLETVTLGGGYIGLLDEVMIFANASSSLLAPEQTIIDPSNPLLLKYLDFDCNLIKDTVSNSSIESIDVAFRNSSLPIYSREIITNEGTNLSFHVGVCETLDYYELLSLPRRGYLVSENGQRITSLSENTANSSYLTYESPDGIENILSDGLAYNVNGQRFDVEILIVPANHPPVFKEIIQRKKGSETELEVTFEDQDLQFASRSETITLSFNSVPLFGVLKYNGSLVGYNTKVCPTKKR